MPLNKKLIGNTFRNARIQKDMTQATLARKTQISVRTIVAIETGSRLPTTRVLYKLTDTLNISSDQVLFPEKSNFTLRQNQLINEFLQSDSSMQEMICDMLCALVRLFNKQKDVKNDNM